MEIRVATITGVASTCSVERRSRLVDACSVSPTSVNDTIVGVSACRGIAVTKLTSTLNSAIPSARAMRSTFGSTRGAESIPQITVD